MERLDLDFLRTRPAIPVVAWLLLAVGIALAMLAGNRYLRVTDDLAREQARAARLMPPADTQRKVAQPERTEPAERDLLAAPWAGLFARLETTRPADIALLGLTADGRKGILILTAEARTAAAMVDYLEVLRRQGGFRAVTLTGHTVVQGDDGIEAVHFIVRLGWGAR